MNHQDTDQYKPRYTEAESDSRLGSEFRDGRAFFSIWAPQADAVHVYRVSLSYLTNWYWPAGGSAASEVQAAQDDLPGVHLPPEAGRFLSLEYSAEEGVWRGDAELATPVDESAFQYMIIRNGEARPLCHPYARALAPFPGPRGGQPWEVLLPPPGHPDSGRLVPPNGWEGLELPVESHPGREKDNRVIYELHVRDMTIHPHSNVAPEKRGSYAGLVEKLDYIAGLGVSHIQLLPVMKCYSIDETLREYNGSPRSGENNYNWGYDPLSYFTPEGWYSVDPEDPYLRISELKTLIKEAHRRGLRIILDVVYNHMADSSLLEPSAPGYWFRRDEHGGFTSNSGCGNDVASERTMVRRLIHHSLEYFVREFHVDGFRFDLMGLLDSRTVLEADEKLRALRPDIMLLGEGWRMYNGEEGTRGMDQDLAAQHCHVAMFSDEIRDMLKGGGLNEASQGFLSGLERDKELVLSNLLGNPRQYFSSHRPLQVVNYLVCHDGLTLRDSLCHNYGIDTSSASGRWELAQRIRAANLLLASSQGIIFLHAGQERGRSKPNPPDSDYSAIGPYVHNSYHSDDGVNAFPWTMEAEFAGLPDHLRKILEFRRNEPLLHLDDHEELHASARLIETPGAFSFAYTISDGSRGIVIGVNLENRSFSCSLKDSLPGGHHFTVIAGDARMEEDLCRMDPFGSLLMTYDIS
ncbi:alpha-amylase family glycosyl hydrolase [Salinispira pacifica]|uniref:Pullulanase n=1 Tax=Salinispira pacifica TaxID=1307761 RepID=V5WDL8_9SPIO|nr:alpha-amylase family glycosyl hydrolase [Salinispira pacifica]AHC13877.1 Pullulanase [Salinispira pacifica]